MIAEIQKHLLYDHFSLSEILTMFASLLTFNKYGQGIPTPSYNSEAKTYGLQIFCIYIETLKSVNA